MKRLTPPWAYPLPSRRKGRTPNESVVALYIICASLQSGPRGRHLQINPRQKEVITAMPASKSKHVTIVLAGSGAQRLDVEIVRGVTTRDLLQQLNLSGHLTKLGDTAPFGENEDVYVRVEDGDKLTLAPTTTVAERR